MQYFFKGNSGKEFAKLPRGVQMQVMRKLDFYMSSPNPLEFAERLKDSDLGEFRFRTGDYRVTFDIEDDIAKILKIGHRKDIYR